MAASCNLVEQGSPSYGPPVVQKIQLPSCLVVSVNVRVSRCLMGHVVLKQLKDRSLAILVVEGPHLNCVCHEFIFFHL